MRLGLAGCSDSGKAHHTKSPAMNFGGVMPTVMQEMNAALRHGRVRQPISSILLGVLKQQREQIAPRLILRVSVVRMANHNRAVAKHSWRNDHRGLHIRCLWPGCSWRGLRSSG